MPNDTFYKTLLKHKCNVYVPTTEYDPITGETKETYPVTPTLVDIPCLLQPLTGKEAIETQGLQIAAEYKGFFKGDADVNLRYKIELDGVFYRVNYVFKGWEGGTHHKEVLLITEVTIDGF